MRRRALLRALIATPLAGWLRRWLPQLFGDPPNAATVYGRAFAWARGLQPDDRERLQYAATLPLDDRHVIALIQHAQPVLTAMRAAASIPRCDWENELLTEGGLLKNQFDVSNIKLISVACLSARRHAQMGRSREALNDLFAGLTLAHRQGTSAVLIGRIWECGGETKAFHSLGRILPQLDCRALGELSRRLDVLPPPEPASAMIGPESRFIVGSIRAKLMAMGPIIAGEAWSELGFDQEEAAALQRLTGGHRAAVLAQLDASGPAFAELGRRLDLPRPGCRAAFDELMQAAKWDYPVVATLRTNGWSARHMVDRMLALRAMARAGLALTRGGESAFRSVSDPFGSGPFGLERQTKGYLLYAALRDDGHPEVTFAVGDATGVSKR